MKPRAGQTVKPNLYFIAGISGSGKTTIGRKLVELGEVAFDSKIQEGLFHFIDKNGKQPTDYQPNNRVWAKKYHWVLNKAMFDDLIKQNSTAKRIFLCGGADDLIRYWPQGKKVFLLMVDTKTMLARLRDEKRDNNFGKDKLTQVCLVERLERYQKRMLKLGAISIDASKSVNKVVNEILIQAV